MAKLKQNEFYCLSCRAKRSCKADNMCVKVYRNRNTGQVPTLKCECPQCGAPLTKFVKQNDQDKMVKKYGKC